MSQNFAPDKPPWVLNCVFAPYTVAGRHLHIG